MQFKSQDSERRRIPAMATLGPCLMRKIGVSEMINEAAPAGRKIVSASTAIEIVSGPIFEGGPRPALMNYTSFYAGGPTEKMFGPKVGPERINATSMSRALDAIYELDRDDLTWRAHEKCDLYFGLESFQFFVDETNIPFGGEIPEDVSTGCPVPAFGGNSKVKKNNIPQYDILGVANSNGELVFSRPYDGNTSDKEMNRDTLEFLSERVEASRYTITADSKMTDRNLIGTILQKGFGMVLKVPKNYSDNLADRVREIARSQMHESERKGMNIYEMDVGTVNGPLRAVAYEFPAKTEKSADMLIRKAVAKVDKALDGFADRVFDSRESADRAFSELICSFGPVPFQFSCVYRQVAVKERWGKKGRPPRSWIPSESIGWSLIPSYEVSEEIATLLAQDVGIQILVTNLPRRDSYPGISDDHNPRDGATAEEVVKLYLDEYHIEWVFRMMKSGAGIDTVYIRTPERECAMIFAISLSVMVKTCLNAAMKKWFGRYAETVDSIAIDLRRLTVEYDADTDCMYFVGERDQRDRFTDLIAAMGLEPQDLLGS